MVSCHTAHSKPVKQEVNGTVILSPLVFPDLTNLKMWCNLIKIFTSRVSSVAYYTEPDTLASTGLVRQASREIPGQAGWARLNRICRVGQSNWVR
jgi:hypothetical protein